MGNAPLRPILITGGGRRIGLALAHHFLNLRHPVIVSYRTEYPSIEGLRKAKLSYQPATILEKYMACLKEHPMNMVKW